MRRHDGSSFEFCDCVFEEWVQSENRMYRDWRRNISISFLQARSPPIVSGLSHSFLSPDGCTAPAHTTGERCIGSRQHGCLPGLCDPHQLNASVPRFPSFNILEGSVLGSIVDLFGGNGSVHTIVLNSGAWGCLDGNNPQSHAYAIIGWRYANATTLARTRGVQRLVWRGTTANVFGLGRRGHICHNESHLMWPILRGAGWHTLDLLHATAAIPQGSPFPGGWWDQSHYSQTYHRGTTEMVLSDLLDDCL